MNHLPKRQRKTHPKETVNVLSNVSFFYVLRLFKKGYKNEFEQEDLYDVTRALKSEKLGAVLERQWKEQKNLKLIRLLCSSFGICYFSLGLMKLLANTLFL
jgi:ATP-binding cassette subfamily C (CFTR/MRP) protein 4